MPSDLTFVPLVGMYSKGAVCCGFLLPAMLWGPPILRRTELLYLRRAVVIQCRLPALGQMAETHLFQLSQNKETLAFQN